MLEKYKNSPPVLVIERENEKSNKQVVSCFHFGEL